MADYITPTTATTTSSLHLSPNRKRTRETTRSANYLPSSCKAAAVATSTSSIEVMETAPIVPTVTQPRSSIHSVQNGLSSIKTTKAEPESTTTTVPASPAPVIVPVIELTNGPTAIQQYAVSIDFDCSSSL